MNPEPLARSLTDTLVFAATTTKSSSSSSVLFLFLLVLFGAYFLFLRPQRNKMRVQQAQRSAAEVGDEVVTTGGIIGRVTSFEGDRVEIEVAPGQHLTFLRSAIGRRIDPVVPESADDDIQGSDTHSAHDGHDVTDPSEPDDSSKPEWWPGSTGDTPPSAPDGSN